MNELQALDIAMEDVCDSIEFPEPAKGALKAAHEMGFEDLMRKMHTQRPIFFKIMELCRIAQQAAVVDEMVDDMQRENSSVYNAANLCVILERADVLERVFEDGTPYVEEEAEPRVVTVDGVEYYEPTEPAKVFWKTTELGLEKIDENQPLERLRAMMADEERYLAIYQRIFELASREQGVPTTKLADELDGDPLLQEPRYYTPRFIDRLEKCEAIEWRGNAWHVTEVGAQFIAQLAQDAAIEQ